MIQLEQIKGELFVINIVFKDYNNHSNHRMKGLLKWWLLAMIFIWVSSTSNQTTCPNSFSESQLLSRATKSRIYAEKLQHQLKTNETRLILAITKYVNKQRIMLTNLGKTLESDITSQASSYIIGLLILGLICIVSLYKLYFTKLQKKQRVNESRSASSTSKLKIHISLAGVAIPLILVIILSIMGYNESNDIDKTINSSLCTFLEPSNGYHRNTTLNQAGIYDYQWFVQQMAKFKDLVVESQRNFFPLTYDMNIEKVSDSAEEVYKKISSEADKAVNESKFIALLNSSTSNIENINKYSKIIKRYTEEYFHMSIECYRQIIKMYEIIIRGLKKEIFKFTDIETISMASENLMKCLYILFLGVSLFSIIAVCKITLNQEQKSYYIRDIALLFLSICGFMSLVFSIINTIILVPVHYTNQVIRAYSDSQERLKNQLAESLVISQLLVTVITRFHPKSNGDYLDISERIYIKSTEELAKNVDWFVENGQKVKKQLQSEGKKLLKGNDKQLMKYLNSITIDLIQKIKLAQTGLKKILVQTSPSSSLFQTDPRGFGRHIQKIINHSIPLFINVITEQRNLLGRCSFSIIISIISLIFLRNFSSRQIVIAVSKQMQMSNIEGGAASDRSDLST